MTPRKSKTDPEIIEMPPQKMAVVYGKGTPEQVFPQIMPALRRALSITFLSSFVIARTDNDIAII